MIKLNNKITYLLAAIFAVVLFVITAFTGGGVETVYAAASSNVVYSRVLDDLKKDSSFSISNYPEKPNDYSLRVIQIAESTDKELFVYVYQPSGQTKKLSASSINISTTIKDKLKYFNYKLQLLNSNGVFFKYKVANFTVKDELTRYYDITSIYRPFDKSLGDKDAKYDNEITEVNYDVSKQYCFSTVNGNPHCSVDDVETVKIKDKFVGFVRYSDGFKFYIGACDSHFVAFNTDKPIDQLLEADVYYTTQSYADSWAAFVGTSEEFGGKKDNYAYLTEEKVEYNGGGLWAGTYSWERIETVEQFIAENDLTQNVYSGAILDVNVANQITDEGKAALLGKKWVLRFVETGYTFWTGDGSYGHFSTLVGDVSILRLKFETDGKTYNLGTIDNKQTGSGEPINRWRYETVVDNRWKRILAIIAALLLLIILSPVLPYIIRPIVWLISLPFKAIGALFEKRGK